MPHARAAARDVAAAIAALVEVIDIEDVVIAVAETVVFFLPLWHLLSLRRLLPFCNLQCFCC